MCALADEFGTFPSIAALANVRFAPEIYASLEAHFVAFLAAIDLHTARCVRRRPIGTMFNGRFCAHKRPMARNRRVTTAPWIRSRSTDHVNPEHRPIEKPSGVRSHSARRIGCGR